VNVPGSADLPRLLRDSSDSVTHLLEALTGEPLTADVLQQYSTRVRAGDGLGVGVDRTITQRIVVLKGHRTGVPYVYAESLFVPERLPLGVRTELEHTSDPIGRILATHGLALAGVDLATPPERTRHALDTVAVGAVIEWARAYRLMMGDVVVFAIREWFFRSVLEARDRLASEASRTDAGSSVTDQVASGHRIRVEEDRVVIVGGVFVVEPDEREEFLAGRHDGMHRSRAEAGCLEYVLSADPIEPSRVVLFERWADQGSLDAHIAALHDAPAAPPGGVTPKSVTLTVYDVSGERPLSV
jgi:chorismate-pyruvate lyase/quinol monooxygenase YgiN